MNFAILGFVLPFFCGLILAQDDATATQSCFPDMCDLLREFGAMKEKLHLLELSQKESNKVIFSAATGGGGKAIGPFNTDTTLTYGRVFVNIGNAFSPSTGVFVAPVAGVYHFTIFFHAGGEHEGKLFLLKNNELMVVTHDQRSESDRADNGGNAVFLLLQTGDQVYVRLPENMHVWGSDYHTTFSGFLVTQS